MSLFRGDTFCSGPAYSLKVRRGRPIDTTKLAHIGLHPGGDDLHPEGDGLHPEGHGLHPEGDGLHLEGDLQ